MRIPESSLAAAILGNITGSLARLARVQEKLATTKRINRPSDDPLGAGLVLRYRAAARGLEAFQRAATDVKACLQATEAALDRVAAVLLEAQKTGLRGANETLDAPARASLSAQVDQLLEELVAHGNTHSGSRYLFGGTQTLTAPFTVQRGADGRITQVSANPRGAGGTICVEVAAGSALQSNVPGSEVFTGGTNLFAVLIALRDGLAADDTAAIASATAALDAGVDQVGAALGAVGARGQRLERVRLRHEQELARVEELRSRVQDADMAELYVEVQRMEHAFQAALAAGSKALQASLLDYLR